MEGRGGRKGQDTLACILEILERPTIATSSVELVARTRSRSAVAWFRVLGLGVGVQFPGCRVQGLGFRVQGSGFGDQDLGFRVEG